LIPVAKKIKIFELLKEELKKVKGQIEKWIMDNGKWKIIYNARSF